MAHLIANRLFEVGTITVIAAAALALWCWAASKVDWSE